MRLRSRSSRWDSGTISISAPVNWRSAGISMRRSTTVGMMNGPGSDAGVGCYQGVVNRAARPGPALLADAAREIALGIDVDQQHPLVGSGQRRSQVDRRGGLADAPLLVGDRYDSRHKWLI